MNEQERAEEHLKTIRRMMERATIYRAISAPTALVGGVLSLMASGYYLKWFHHFGPGDYIAGEQNNFLRLWMLVLILTGVANTIFIVAGSRKHGEPVLSTSMKAAFIALAPALVAGGAFTLYFAGMGWIPLVDFYMAVGWSIFYGLALLATSHFAPRSLTLLGYAFLVSGLVAFLVYRFSNGFFIDVISGEPDTQPTGILFMALTFGLYHLIYALCAWPRKGAAPEL
jgi:lipoprotein signal peptidase